MGMFKLHSVQLSFADASRLSRVFASRMEEKSDKSEALNLGSNKTSLTSRLSSWCDFCFEPVHIQSTKANTDQFVKESASRVLEGALSIELLFAEDAEGFEGCDGTEYAERMEGLGGMEGTERMEGNGQRVELAMRLDSFSLTGMLDI